MARELVTHIWCDVCLSEDDAYVEGEETPPVVIGSIKPRVLGLCETHRKLFVEFRTLLMDVGQIVDVPAPRREGGATGEFPCPACDRVYSYRSSLNSHVERAHGKTIAELRAEVPDAPLFEEGDDETPPPLTRAECGVDGCDVVYEWPKHKRPAQAIGVHRRQAHGIKGQKAK